MKVFGYEGKRAVRAEAVLRDGHGDAIKFLSATARGLKSVEVEYDRDPYGNWVKARIKSAKDQQGEEAKPETEILRSITYYAVDK